MSSKTWIWIVVAVVVVGAGLWYMGVFNMSGQQGAAAVTAGDNSQALSNDSLKADLAKIDSQLASVNAAVNSLGSSPTKAQINTAAASMAPTVAAMGMLANKLSARMTNTKTSGGAVPSKQTIADFASQLSNASSAASTAGRNAMATSSSATTLSTSASQLKTAATALAAARADLGSIFSTLGIQ